MQLRPFVAQAANLAHSPKQRGPWARRPSPWHLDSRPLVAIFVLGLAMGCDRAAVAPVTGELTITSPTEGETVDTNPVIVSGTAPPGAQIVRDVRFSPDDETTAGADGHWSMEVDLEDGDNDLTFRLGDDKSTAITLSVVLSGVAQATDELTITEPDDGTVATGDSILVRGSAPPGSVVVQDVSFAPDERTTADSDGRWEIEASLYDGENELTFRLDDDEDVTAVVNVTYREPVAAATPRPSSQPPADPMARMEAAVREVFEGSNNRDVPYLTDLEIIPQVDGGYGVAVTYSADDNFGAGFIRAGIESRMQDAYEAVFTSGVDVRWASVLATFSLVDQFGNAEEGAVYKTILERDAADLLNWDEPYLVEWPAVWETTILNPELQE